MEKKTFKDRVDDAIKWCGENKEVLVVTIPLAVAGITAVTKLGGKLIGTYNERVLQDKSIYDHSFGTYWKLRRALTNNDRLLIERRRAAGEKLGDILKDMRLLK